MLTRVTAGYVDIAVFAAGVSVVESYPTNGQQKQKTNNKLTIR